MGKKFFSADDQKEENHLLSNMLPKDFRLPVTPYSPFTHTYKTPFFLLKIRSNNSTRSRFGFTVSKKIDTRAVVRNQSRRKLQMSLHELLPHVKPGYDFLFIASSNIKECSMDELKLCINDLFQKNDFLQ